MSRHQPSQPVRAFTEGQRVQARNYHGLEKWKAGITVKCIGRIFFMWSDWTMDTLLRDTSTSLLLQRELAKPLKPT